MISDLKPYAEYKNSGLPWIGQVPEHWKTERAKWLFTKMTRSVRAEDEIVTCFRDGMVTLRKNRRLRGFTEATVEHGYQGIRKGDLVIHGMDAFAGAIGVSDSDGKGTPVYNVCLPSEGVNARYYAHLIRVMSQSQWILALAKGIRERSTDFRFETFGNQRITLPPPDEQAAIVRFLNWANGQLEKAIRAKRKIITLLNEQKQVIIHRAVTRGLDPSVPLKPSGISWLGDIPEHWEVRRLKNLFVRIVGGATPASGNPCYWNGDVVWITPADVSKSAFLKDSVRKISLKGLRSCSTEIVPINSIVFTSRAPVGNVAITNVPLTINQGCKALIPDVSIIRPMYAFWLISTMKRELQRRASGTTFFEISTTKLAASATAFCSVKEQEKILDFITRETNSLNSAISLYEREIELLCEYRTRLVADVVTGKLDVREAAKRLPEDAEEVADDSSALIEDTEEAFEEFEAAEVT